MGTNGIDTATKKIVDTSSYDTASLGDTAQDTATSNQDTYECDSTPIPTSTSSWSSWVIDYKDYLPDSLVKYAKDSKEESQKEVVQASANSLRQANPSKITSQMICDFLSQEPDADLLLSTLFPILNNEDQTSFEVKKIIYDTIIDRPDLAPGLAQRLKEGSKRTMASSALRDMSQLKHHSEAALALIQIQVEKFNGSYEPLGSYGLDPSFGPGWHKAVNQTLKAIGLGSTEVQINWLIQVSQGNDCDTEARNKAQELLKKLEDRYPN